MVQVETPHGPQYVRPSAVAWITAPFGGSPVNPALRNVYLIGGTGTALLTVLDTPDNLAKLGVGG